MMAPSPALSWFTMTAAIIVANSGADDPIAISVADDTTCACAHARRAFPVNQPRRQASCRRHESCAHSHAHAPTRAGRLAESLVSLQGRLAESLVALQGRLPESLVALQGRLAGSLPVLQGRLPAPTSSMSIFSLMTYARTACRCT